MMEEIIKRFMLDREIVQITKKEYDAVVKDLESCTNHIQNGPILTICGRKFEVI
jgi:hypothetical protein